MASLSPQPAEGRTLTIVDDQEAVSFAANHFIATARAAISARGQFIVALSGGNTPKAIFQELLTRQAEVDWSRVLLFWSDERAVAPTDAESNYKMAMDAAFSHLIPADHIFRMYAELDLEEEARKYEIIIKSRVKAFDLVMLGMGDDGHTASLFPHTKALDITGRLVAANDVPQKRCRRMTLTYDGIAYSRLVVFYVFGKNKASMVKQVLQGSYDFHEYPSQRVHALWLLDKSAASLLTC